VDFSKYLNPEQQKAVETTETPVLVLAGAGSGKTRTVIYRAAHLIANKHVNPYNILIVTFTNKAARELRDRLEKTFHIPVRNLWVGTFHSICARILRVESDQTGFTSDFTIYDTDDQSGLVKKVLSDLEIDSKRINPTKARNVISRQKNQLVRPEDFFEFNSENYYSKEVFKIYQEYQKRLRKNNAMDFDDLLMNTAFLLNDHPQLRDKYASLFKYVMIDEYQDTNYAQFKLIHLIAEKHQRICVVGDDDQAIYSWRGATIKNILNFEKDYQNVTIVRLEQNYRSTQPILQIANKLIEKNTQRHEKALWSDQKSDSKPEIFTLDRDIDECDFIANEISQLHRKEDIPFKEIAVLYRTNAQSRNFENSFIRHGIPFQIIGTINFFQRAEIKNILAYLRTIVNPQDDESLLRIINYPIRGIGDSSLEKIKEFAILSNITLREAVLNPAILDFLKGKAYKGISDLSEKLNNWIELAVHYSAPDLMIKVINDTGILNIFENSSDQQDISRVENIKELIASAEEFIDNIEDDKSQNKLLSDYLQSISLVADVDNMRNNENSVKLMTIHNAKGLEFDCVFVSGVEDGLIPHSLTINEPEQIEEERRLLYVAITRARKLLRLTLSRYRRTFDSVMPAIPSRFLREIDKELFNDEPENIYQYAPPVQTRKSKPRMIMLESEKFFRIGQRVFHETFGQGEVLNVEGSGKDAKLTISFSKGELKKIIGTFVQPV